MAHGRGAWEAGNGKHRARGDRSIRHGGVGGYGDDSPRGEEDNRAEGDDGCRSNHLPGKDDAQEEVSVNGRSDHCVGSHLEAGQGVSKRHKKVLNQGWYGHQLHSEQ